jgi:Flp pilus assembly protein TadG
MKRDNRKQVSGLNTQPKYPHRHMRTRGQRGNALVEFALVLPLLLLILFGTIEFSIALYDKAIITNASREAARAGVVYKVPQLTVAQIQSVATNYMQSHLITFGTSGSPTVNVSQSSGTTSWQSADSNSQLFICRPIAGSLVQPNTEGAPDLRSDHDELRITASAYCMRIGAENENSKTSPAGSET